MKSKTGLDDWDVPGDIGRAAAEKVHSRPTLGRTDTRQTARGLPFKAIAVCCALMAQAALSASVAPNPSSTNDVDRLGHVTLIGDIPINELPNSQQEPDRIWSYLTRRKIFPS